jgi:hypothetical protein
LTKIGEDRLYLSIGSAVTDFKRRWPPEAIAAADEAATGPGQPPNGPPADASEAASEPRPEGATPDDA